MFDQVLVAALHNLVAQEGALLDYESFAGTTVAPPVLVGDDLVAGLTPEIDQLQLVA